MAIDATVTVTLPVMREVFHGTAGTARIAKRAHVSVAKVSSVLSYLDRYGFSERDAEGRLRLSHKGVSQMRKLSGESL